MDEILRLITDLVYKSGGNCSLKEIKEVVRKIENLLVDYKRGDLVKYRDSDNRVFKVKRWIHNIYKSNKLLCIGTRYI